MNAGGWVGKLMGTFAFTFTLQRIVFDIQNFPFSSFSSPFPTTTTTTTKLIINSDDFNGWIFVFSYFTLNFIFFSHFILKWWLKMMLEWSLKKAYKADDDDDECQNVMHFFIFHRIIIMQNSVFSFFFYHHHYWGNLNIYLERMMIKL